MQAPVTQAPPPLVSAEAPSLLHVGAGGWSHIPHEPPQPSSPHDFPAQFGVHPAAHTPALHEPCAQLPHEPPQPSSPHDLPAHFGVHEAVTHAPDAQPWAHVASVCVNAHTPFDWHAPALNVRSAPETHSGVGGESQLPQEPLQPSSPQWRPAQFGVQVAGASAGVQAASAASRARARSIGRAYFVQLCKATTTSTPPRRERQEAASPSGLTTGA